MQERMFLRSPSLLCLSIIVQITIVMRNLFPTIEKKIKLGDQIYEKERLCSNYKNISRRLLTCYYVHSTLLIGMIEYWTCWINLTP